MRNVRRRSAALSTIGAFDAKTHLSRLLEDVKGGAVVTITLRGVPAARLVPMEAEVRLPARVDVDGWLAHAATLRETNRRGAESVSGLVRAGRRP